MNTPSVTSESAGVLAAAPRRVILITGLSGGGKASALRVLEDLGYEAVDNPPLPLLEEMVVRGERPTAICVDTRSRGFDADAILAMITRLRSNPALRPEMVFILADEIVLLRRFTETRRRHPLAPTSRVADGVAAEVALTARLREAADFVLDTTDLPLPMLRRIIEQRYSASATAEAGMTVSLMSFAYPAGLPREAELVFDARFLRNPHYDLILRERTGLDPQVAAYVAADPDFTPFVDKVTDLLSLLLPRFVQEGKKYASVAVGCTGGKHRSVHIVQKLAERLQRLLPEATQIGPRQDEAARAWRVVVTHRELMRSQAGGALRAAGPVSGPDAHAVERVPGAGGLTDIP